MQYISDERIQSCARVFSTDIPGETDVYAMAGDPLTLTCQLSSDSSVNCSTPFFKKISRNHPLGSPVPQRKVSEWVVELVIVQVSADDEGKYFCYTGLDDDSTTTTTTTDGITVIVISQFNCISVVIIRQDKNVLLHRPTCSEKLEYRKFIPKYKKYKTHVKHRHNHKHQRHRLSNNLFQIFKRTLHSRPLLFRAVRRYTCLNIISCCFVVIGSRSSNYN